MDQRKIQTKEMDSVAEAGPGNGQYWEKIACMNKTVLVSVIRRKQLMIA